jgi:hypothetical protein
MSEDACSTKEISVNKFARVIRNNKAVALLASLTAAGAHAQAVGADYSSLTGAVDWSTVGVALLAIAALMMGPKAIGWGARKILGFVRG